MIADPFFDAYGPDAWSIYVHVPFCEQKCAYCDFFTITDPDRSHPLRDRWLDLCLIELDLWLERVPTLTTRLLGTISFGGGTPSLLPAKAIGEFLACLRSRVTVSDSAEISLEIQPGTVSAKDLHYLSQYGVTRFSIGVQTLDDTVLSKTARRHTSSDSLNTLAWAMETGCQVGTDFIANMPGEDLDQFLNHMSKVANLGVHHMSTYDLTWHDGTDWERMRRQGMLVPASEDERLLWQSRIIELAKELGFQTYEISNHCRMACESRHNCAYWEGADYLGLGAGAHGFVRPGRSFNPPQAQAWARSILSGSLYARATDATDTAIYITENLHMALRKITGVNRDLFQHRFGVDPVDYYQGAWAELKLSGLADWDTQRVWLTPQGQMVLDGITEHLVSQVSVRSAIPPHQP